MEFCPEVAVLQSAFQLVQNKAGKKLATLSKTECSDYVLILKSTLDEICQGLECDLDLQDQLLWQQNMHTLILYGLLKKTYKTEEKKSGIPVFSSLDVLVQVLPQFSRHLYVELVKECSWEHLMIDSLPYLDSSLASELLLDVIEHCVEEPVTLDDYKIINSIRETVIEKLLCVPYEVDSVLEKQLKPLSRPAKYKPVSIDNPDELDMLSAHEKSKVTEAVDSSQNDATEEGESVKIRDNVLDVDQLGISTENNQDIDHDVPNVDTGTDKETASTDIFVDNARTDTNMNLGKSDLTYNRQFWNKFLCENSTVFESLLLFTERYVRTIGTDTDHLSFLAQLGVLGYIKINEFMKNIPVSETMFSLDKNIEIPFYWLINNLFYENCQETGNPNSAFEISPIYIVDQTISGELCKQIRAKNWIQCLHTILKCTIAGMKNVVHQDSKLTNGIAKQTGSENSRSNKSTHKSDNNESYLHIVSGLCLHRDVLFRMMDGCLMIIGDTASSDVVISLNECQDMVKQLKNMTSYKIADEKPDTDKTKPGEVVENVNDKGDPLVRNGTELGCWCSENEGKSVKFGVSWKSDVSLEALCWRIKYRMPYFQECTEELLHPSCQGFWLDERVYEAFYDNIPLLATKERVLKLIDLLQNVQSATGEVILKTQQLTCAAFSGLSFLNQDSVAMEVYSQHESLRECLGLQEMQTMTVFNRITALRDDQILSELFQLCICDPRDVIATAVRMSVRNKEQATNLAQVLQFFPKISQSVHPTHHPHTALLGHVTSEFLLTTTLTEKEQAAFVVFLNTVLQVPNNQQNVPLLSPVELLELSILPFIGVHSLHNSGPVSCKFALTMLKAVLEHGCYTSSDWEKFEPMGLVLCLAELLQECVALWDCGDTVSGQIKITVKSLVLECLKLLGDALCKENLVLKGTCSVESLYHCLAEMDFPVVLQLLETISLLNIAQYNDNYQKALEELLKYPVKHLAAILLIVSGSRDENLLLELTEAIGRRGGQLAYDDVIIALIQVLPNMLSVEFEKTVRCIMTLIEKDVLPVPYRSGTTGHLPLTGIKGCESTLGVSQILRDVIITLGFITDRDDMLQHMLQCYTASLKSLTCAITPKSNKLEIDLFMVSQLFLHVSDIVHLLPTPTTEPVLVLLLHLLTLYTDILNNSQYWVGRQKWRERFVEGMTDSIILSVNSLPDSLVEKEMLLKKITGATSWENQQSA